MAVYALIVASLVTAVRSHGRLTIPISRKGPGYQNDPVGGYNSDDWVCRESTKNPLFETAISAGGELTLRWDFGAAHVGDCAVYISYDVSSDRAQQKYFKIANLPRCKDKNGQDVKISIPDFLPAGPAILRWDWYALHVFPTVEFYSQCVDVEIFSTSSVQKNQLETYSIISPPVYPANGNTGKGFRNPWGGGEQFMTGPACAHGYTGNNCGLTAVGTRGNTRQGGGALIVGGGGGGGGITTTADVSVTLTPLCEVYIAVEGDTMSSIAEKFTNEGKAVTSQQICVANGKAADCNTIDVGDNYIIPYAGSPCVSAGVATTTTAKPQPPLCEIYSKVVSDDLDKILDVQRSQCEGGTREQMCAHADTDCSQCSVSVQQICTITLSFVKTICATPPIAGSSTASPTTEPITPTSSQSIATTQSSIESPTTAPISSMSSQSTTSNPSSGSPTAGPISSTGSQSTTLDSSSGSPTTKPILSTSSQPEDIGSSTTESPIAVVSGVYVLLLSPITMFALVAGRCVD